MIFYNALLETFALYTTVFTPPPPPTTPNHHGYLREGRMEKKEFASLTVVGGVLVLNNFLVFCYVFRDSPVAKLVKHGIVYMSWRGHRDSWGK